MATAVCRILSPSRIWVHPEWPPIHDERLLLPGVVCACDVRAATSQGTFVCCVMCALEGEDGGGGSNSTWLHRSGTHFSRQPAHTALLYRTEPLTFATGWAVQCWAHSAGIGQPCHWWLLFYILYAMTLIGIVYRTHPYCERGAVMRKCIHTAAMVSFCMQGGYGKQWRRPQQLMFVYNI